MLFSYFFVVFSPKGACSVYHSIFGLFSFTFVHLGTSKCPKLSHDIVRKLVLNFATLWGPVWFRFGFLLGPPKPLQNRPRLSKVAPWWHQLRFRRPSRFPYSHFGFSWASFGPPEGRFCAPFPSLWAHFGVSWAPFRLPGRALSLLL